MADWATERNHVFQVGGIKEQASRILDGLTDLQPWFRGIMTIISQDGKLQFQFTMELLTNRFDVRGRLYLTRKQPRILHFIFRKVTTILRDEKLHLLIVNRTPHHGRCMGSVVEAVVCTFKEG